MNQKIISIDKKVFEAVIVIFLITLLATVVIAVRYKERAPSYSFAFSAEGLSDGKGNTIDIFGGGKFSYMAWGPGGWYWNVYIDGHGSITFVTAEDEEFVKWKLKPIGRLVSNGLYDQLTGTLTFTLDTRGKLPSLVAEPIEVTLIEGGETDSITIKIGEISTYSGTGVVLTQLQ